MLSFLGRFGQGKAHIGLNVLGTPQGPPHGPPRDPAWELPFFNRFGSWNTRQNHTIPLDVFLAVWMFQGPPGDPHVVTPPFVHCNSVM